MSSPRESFLRSAAATEATKTHNVAPKTRLKIRSGTPTIAELSRTNAQATPTRCMSTAISTLWVWS